MLNKKIKRGIIGLLVLTAIVGGILVIPNKSKKSEAASSNSGNSIHNGNDWMKYVSSDESIGELSIPGTHDTCTYNTSGITSRVSKCQNKTLSEQFNMGVRYIDIRCRNYNNTFSIHHGDDYLNMNFNQVLSECYSFLDKNPSECIVMSVKEEKSNTKEAFVSKFNEYIQNASNKWYHGSNVPTLGEARGKIVLVRRFAGGDFGIDASNWKDNATFNYGNLFVQDQYQTSNVSDKMIAVDSFFKNISKNKNSMYINYTSATMYGKDTGSNIWSFISNDSIESLANDINTELRKYNFKQNTCYGIVAMDFADEELCKKIYETNVY